MKDDTTEAIIGLTFTELIASEYPEWLTGEKNGRAKELAQAIVGALTQKKIMEIQDRLQTEGKSVDLKDKDVVSRITAEALLGAVNETGMLNETILRSQAHILIWAQKAHAFLYDEASSLQEWLNTKLAGVQHPSQVSDITFLVNEALPMLERANIGNVDDLLDIAGFYSRLRDSVPHWRAKHIQYLNATKDEATAVERIERKIAIREKRVDESTVGSAVHTKAVEELSTLEGEKGAIEAVIIEKSEVAIDEYENTIVRVIETVRDETIPQSEIKSTLSGTGPSMVGYKMLRKDGSIEYRIVLNASSSMYLEHKTPGIDWRISDFVSKTHKA